MIVDVVMLACSKSPELINMTQAAINSIHASETDHSFNIILVESHEVYNYAGASVIKPLTEFNYNKYMNLGLQLCIHEWVTLANNDLIFHKNWFSAILAASEELPDVKSFSSFAAQHYKAKMNNKYYVEYGVGTYVTGWCLTIKREIFDTIKLNENVNFWCSDNTYQDDLIKNGIKHALIRDSHIDHLGGVTLFSMTPKQIHNYTATQAMIYANMPK